MLDCDEELRSAQRVVPYWSHGTFASLEFWLRGKDLNLRPLGYEPNELPGCSTPRQEGAPYRRPGNRSSPSPAGPAPVRPLGYEPNELSPDSFRSPGRSRERFFGETRKPDDGDAGAHRRGGLTKYSPEKIRGAVGMIGRSAGWAAPPRVRKAHLIEGGA